MHTFGAIPAMNWVIALWVDYRKPKPCSELESLVSGSHMVGLMLLEVSVLEIMAGYPATPFRYVIDVACSMCSHEEQWRLAAIVGVVVVHCNLLCVPSYAQSEAINQPTLGESRGDGCCHHYLVSMVAPCDY